MTKTNTYSTLDVALASMAITRGMPHSYVTSTWPGIFALPAIRKAAKDYAKEYIFADTDVDGIHWRIYERGVNERLERIFGSQAMAAE